MSALREFYNSVVNAPGKAIHGIAEYENEAEHTVVQAGVDYAKDHGVISADTAQGIMHAEEVAQGIREGAADVTSGLVKTAIDPVGTGMDMGKAMADAYTKAGGGVDGVLDAANTVNPLYHAAVAGIEAYNAAERGDYKGAGRQGTHAAVDVAATVGIAVGGAALAEGALGAGAAEAGAAEAGVAESGVAEAGAGEIPPDVQVPVDPAADPMAPTVPDPPVQVDPVEVDPGASTQPAPTLETPYAPETPAVDPANPAEVTPPDPATPEVTDPGQVTDPGADPGPPTLRSPTDPVPYEAPPAPDVTVEDPPAAPDPGPQAPLDPPGDSPGFVPESQIEAPDAPAPETPYAPTQADPMAPTDPAPACTADDAAPADGQ